MEDSQQPDYPERKKAESLRSTPAQLAAGTSVSEFSRWKASALGKADLSRKGSIDDEIYDLVNFINNQDDYFTTSSCSGRILLCSDDSLPQNDENNIEIKTSSKKNCIWFFVSHKIFDAAEIFHAIASLKSACKFKFEPFVLHAQCRTLEKARLLHQAAVQAGFRNSGITFGKAGKKIIVAVRATACLEVPLTDENGQRLTSDEYVRYIVKISHQKLSNNFRMIKIFEESFCKLSTDVMKHLEKPKIKKGVYRRRGKTARAECTGTEEYDGTETVGLFEENLLAQS